MIKIGILGVAAVALVLGLLLHQFSWSGWIIGIFVLGILFLAWLSIGVRTAPKESISPPDQVWDDDLREGNAIPPQWWFYSLFATLIFSAAYVMLYPGFGFLPGLLSWTQHSQYDEGLAYYKQKTEAIHRNWETGALDELRKDRSAMESAKRIYLLHCASCHGDDALGQAGVFPNLADDEWSWGGEDEQILETLNAGRVAVMPGWRQLGDEQVAAVTDYVIALSQGQADAGQFELGRKVYAANCAACHGANAEGNPTLGAPKFAGGHAWQYLPPGGDLREAVLKTVNEGRQGVMPAQSGRLRQAQIRVLAAWLGGGMEVAPLAGQP